MSEVVAGVVVLDTELVRAATAVVLEGADELLFHHSRRVFLKGSLKVAAQAFLLEHGRSEQDAGNVWSAIALHTTPEVPEHLSPEVLAVALGVKTDVLGAGLDEQRDAVVRASSAGLQEPHPACVLRRHGSSARYDTGR